MLTVGHNDAGYLPCTDPVVVQTLEEGIQVLCAEVRNWFSVELDGDELTEYELRQFIARVQTLRQRSTLILKGHAFWIQ